MTLSIAKQPTTRDPIGVTEARLYLVAALLVLGNLLLPALVHRLPQGGQAFLPIFFFTLVGGWRFGAAAGILTGTLSPVVNHLLTGMPAGPVLPSLTLQSVMLGGLAAAAAAGGRKPGLGALAALVGLHQALTLLPLALQAGIPTALAALQLRAPGLLLQVAGGSALLSWLARLPAGSGDAARGE